MTIQNRRTVGQQVSRGGQIRTAQYLTAVPWVFTITPHNQLYYPQVRDVIQAIDNKDRLTSETISFDVTPTTSGLYPVNLRWFVQYLGAAASTPTGITVAAQPAANATSISLTNIPAATGNIFKAGDFIMISGYTYKVTADVPRASTITVPLHRPIVGTPPVATTPVSCAENVRFTVYAEQCPTYTLTPMTGGAFVNWDGPFVFREAIAP